MSVDTLLTQPWTRRGPVEDVQDGKTLYRVTIDELPGFLVVGSTPYEAITNERPALRAFLSARIEHGNQITPPSNQNASQTPADQDIGHEDSDNPALDELMSLPWTRCGPAEAAIAGELFFKLTIEELPRFVVTGMTPFEVISNEQRALRNFLIAELEKGHDIPRPYSPDDM